MSSWLEKPGSLNWANKQKLSEHIGRFEKNIGATKDKLTQLLSIVNHWEVHCQELSELSNKQQLTAKHILHLKPFLDQSENFQQLLNALFFEEIITQHNAAPK